MSISEAFAGLERIDWAAMGHAYGPASDVPALLRKLVAVDAREREIAVDGMYGAIHHQGDVYDCTLAAIPFLLRIAADPDLPGRADVLRLIVSIGGVDQPDEPVDLRGNFFGAAAAAVAQGCPALLPSLADPDPEVRVAVSEVLRARRSDADDVLAALWQRLAVEPDPAVAAALVTTVGTVAGRAGDGDLTDTPARLTALSTGAGHPQVRLPPPGWPAAAMNP